jgi:hypothetical protein
MAITHQINGRAELLLRPDFETTSAAMWSSLPSPAPLRLLAGNGQSGSFALPLARWVLWR